MKKIAVMGGGPVDSRMGVDYLAEHGLNGYSYPAARDGRELNNLQLCPMEQRKSRVREIICRAKADGMDALMVYCNALSSMVDVPKIAEEEGLPAVSPLMMYHRYACRYQNIGIMSGNCAGLAGVEHALLTANPGLVISGLGVQPVILAIEAAVPPETCVERFGLGAAAEFFGRSGCEAIVLGCTHLPYLAAALQRCTTLPVLNPTENMVETIKERL